MVESKAGSASAQMKRPLAKLTLIEKFGNRSTDPSRAAISFAGMLAAQFGARVIRLEPDGGDPMRHWEPLDSQGSVLYGFLTQSKIVTGTIEAPHDSFLLTDDPGVLEAWSGPRSVYVRPLPVENGEPVSELTLMARSGLLDIFGTEGQKPQPLPGHQIAYSGGIAAFNGLMSAFLSVLRTGHVEPVAVSLLDVALWVNWKHFLAGGQGREAGLKRKEEWSSLRCADGYIALTFQNKDMAGLAELTGNDYFRSPALATRALRMAHITEINGALEAWSRHHTRAHIAERAKALRLPVGAVLSLSEVVEDAHINHRRFFSLCGDGRRFPRLPLFWNGQPIQDQAQFVEAPLRAAQGNRR